MTYRKVGCLGKFLQHYSIKINERGLEERIDSLEQGNNSFDSFEQGLS